MSKNKSWKIYEEIVIKLLKSKNLFFEYEDGKDYNFADAKELDNKIKVKGAGSDGPIEHQIDVQLLNEKENIYLYGECKFHDARIEKSEVSSFIKVIENIKEYDKNKRIIPIFISNSEFNDGALQMMDYYKCDYLVFNFKKRPHFVFNDFVVKEYFCNNRWHQYDNSYFYNEHSGTSETLDYVVNMFLSYKLGKKHFSLGECKKSNKYTIICADPLVDIFSIKNQEIIKSERVTKIKIEYIHNLKTLKRNREISNGEIGIMKMNNTKYKVFKNFVMSEIKKINT